MTRDSRPTPLAEVIVQRAGDAQVLLHTGTGQYYTLDDVGGRIWALCDGQRTVADIVSRLCDEYDAPREQIEADALELLTDLEGERLLAARS
jgi:coenzyme PQQ biosynthesis protein PqqD